MPGLAKGSCQCKAVQYEVSGQFESFFLCHCTRCQKDTGSAHAANLFSQTATINWVYGQDKITTYHLPETQHQKSFCSLCGAAVPTMQAEGTLLVVPAGSLDSKVPIRPDAHISVSSRASWDHNLHDIPTIDTLPG